jgi:hypothetical protein
VRCFGLLGDNIIGVEHAAPLPFLEPLAGCRGAAFAKVPYYIFLYGTPYCSVPLLISILIARCKIEKSHKLKQK